MASSSIAQSVAAPGPIWCPESLPYVTMPRAAPFGPASRAPVRLGMTPFIPPPPSWMARPLHDAGSTTRKLMAGVAGLRLTGAIDPETAQNENAGSCPPVHTGADRLTDDTGSPMALAGTAVPSFAAMQS